MLGKSANVVLRQRGWLPRSSCLRCRRPLAACYCTVVKPFESKPRFVILTHPKEAKHSFGTGRMAYLCIRNSLRIEGADFSEDETTNRMIQDPDLFSVVLYPGPGATNLSMVPAAQRAALVPTGARAQLTAAQAKVKELQAEVDKGKPAAEPKKEEKK